MTVHRATLEPEERSPAAARRIVRGALLEAGLESVLDEALLLTTELVTNALVHAGTEVGLDVEVDADRLRVEVSDRGAGRVGIGEAPSEEREGGRGIFLVDAIATAWGTRNTAEGKSVWFELGAAAEVATRAAAQTRAASPRRDLAFVLGLAPDLEARLGPARLVEELLARIVEGLDLLRGWVVACPPAEVQWTIYAGYDDTPGPDPEAVCRGLAAGWPSVPFAGADGIVLGALVLGRAPSGADEFALVRLVAERIGVVLRDEHARVAQLRARGSLALRAEAGEMFAGTLDLELTATLAGRLVVPRLGRWSAVWTLGAPGPVLQTVAHADEVGGEKVRASLIELGHEWVREQARELVGEQVRLVPGKAFAAICGGAPEWPVRAGGAPEWDGAPSGECAVLPLSARGRVLGLMVVSSEPGRSFAADETALLVDLARTAALAMDNARLYEERSAVAEALQASLLPPELPAAAWCEFGARYSAAGEGNDVGGDFYDVFPLAVDGTDADGWGIAIGDVCGKGPAAAAITGIAREVLRLLIRDGQTPRNALWRLNETLLALGERGKLCTVVLGTVRRRSDGVAVRFSSAGHPPPVHLDGTAGARFVGGSGTLLGVVGDIDVSDDEVVLAPGESLVFYTDGVTERRGSSGADLFGEDNLLAALRTTQGAGAAEIAARVEGATQRFGAPSVAPRDDLAVLVVRAGEAGQ